MLGISNIFQISLLNKADEKRCKRKAVKKMSSHQIFNTQNLKKKPVSQCFFEA